MKLRELFRIIKAVADNNNIATPMICGGAVREKVMGTLTKLSDIDITNGDFSIKNLAKEVELELLKRFSVTSKTMSDGHTSLFLSNLKIDFSSNFILPNIDQELGKRGIKNHSGIIKESFSRDFTCNSLLMDFELKKIFDPTKRGIEDINNKIIKTCVSPELTLSYNVNRIIRVIYLASKLNFNIDSEIIKFIKQNKSLVTHIDSRYLSSVLNKAAMYNASKTASSIDSLDLWGHLPITESLHSHYVKRFKTASIRFASNAKPSNDDLEDAISHADIYGTEEWSIEDFDLKFEGNLTVNELKEFDSLDWMDIEPGAKHNSSDLDSFRGNKWIERARSWVKSGIPPIVVITAPTPYESKKESLLTQIGDGRGRVNFAELMNLRVPVWHLIYKSNVKTAQLRNNFDYGKGFYSNLSNKKTASTTESKLNGLRHKMADAAQEILNDWKQDEEGFDEMYGCGGACDNISNSIAEIIVQSFQSLGLDVMDGGHEGDDHAYVIAYNDDEAFGIDIHPNLYETGGGYSWKKIQNAKIRPRDIDIWKIDRKDLGDIEKFAYYNGIDDYLVDNFPIILNDDLEVNMDRKENDVEADCSDDDDENEDEEKDCNYSMLEPTSYSDHMYSSMHGGEGLFAFPLSDYPGRLGEDNGGTVVNNDYNKLFQFNGLFESKSAEETDDLLTKLSIK